MNTISQEAQASSNTAGVESSSTSPLLDENQIEETENEQEVCGVNQNESSSADEIQMSFKSLTPLRKKTLELLRENPDLDGATADRMAKEALGLIAPVSQSFSRVNRNRNAFVPAPGNLGTSHSKNDFNKETIFERLQNLPMADRQEAFLKVLSAAAEKSRKK